MARSFSPLQQPLGSNSCLPTAVRAVLRYHGEEVSQEQVSEWCREDVDGCVFFLALQGLQEAGLDVIEVREEDQLCEILTEDEAEPVIITIRDPGGDAASDHAVVVFAMHEESGGGRLVEYMDPIDGANHQDNTGFLLQWWDYSGNHGFAVRP